MWAVTRLCHRTEAAAEAYELVERGLVMQGDFRTFAFTNPVTLFGSMNPDFFKGAREWRRSRARCFQRWGRPPDRYATTLNGILG